MAAQGTMHATELRATIANPGLFSESPTFPGLIELNHNWPQDPQSACADLAEDCCAMEGLFSHQGN